jgi:hypothetical protein
MTPAAPAVSSSSGLVAGPAPETRVVPSPGDPLAIGLYRMLQERSATDLQHVLAAIRATGALGGVRGAHCEEEDERVAHARWSLNEACQKLDCIPSRRAYDKWRSGRPVPEGYASPTTIRRFLGEGDWSKALEELGAPRPDVTARTRSTPHSRRRYDANGDRAC